MDTLRLFDNITVDNHKRISEEDEARVHSLTQAFHATLTNLYDYRDIFLEKLKDAPDTVRVTYNKVEVIDRLRFSSESSPEERMTALAFHPLFGLETVSNLARKAADSFEDAVVRYFSSTYSGDFKNRNITRNALFGEIFSDDGRIVHEKLAYDKLPELPKERKFPDATPIIDYIIESLGGQDFHTNARNLAKENFVKEAGRSHELKGNTIVLSYYVHRDYWDEDRDTISLSGSRNVSLALDAVEAYEDCASFHNPVFRDNVNFNSLYGVPESRTLQGFTVHKNRNMKLKFHSAQMAKDFYEYCFGPVNS